jgi:sugar lactone lactonase YvrE
LVVTIAVLIVVCAAASYAPDNPYRVIDGWAKLPDGRTWGSTAAVDVDANDHIWVAERCGANSCAGSNLAPILEFDQSGKLLTSFGAGLFVSPHGIGVDKEGNIWVTDWRGENGKGHQVFKFSRDGKILLTLGKAGIAGDGPETFNQPYDVIVAPNGDIFVADGHGGNSNTRIVKFSRDGKFIKQWNQFSRPSGIFIDAKDNIYVSDSESNSVRPHPGWKRGIRIGNISDAFITAFIPDPVENTKGSSMAEGVAADSQGNIYGAEGGSTGRGIKQYVKK